MLTGQTNSGVNDVTEQLQLAEPLTQVGMVSLRRLPVTFYWGLQVIVQDLFHSIEVEHLVGGGEKRGRR